MIFDTHAHYDDGRFNDDRERILKSLKSLNIGTVINATASFESLSECAKLTEEYDFMYCTAGLHPSDLKELPEGALEEVSRYAKRDKCLAIGEIGLDYYWEKDEKERANQRDWFNKQLDLAYELDMPVVIHSREACEDTLEILKKAANRGQICDIHCFSYSPEIAGEYVKLGFYIGVGGVVTYSNGKKLKETVEKIPLTRILLETDCPYLAPHPFRGQRNDSTYLPYVIRAIASIKGITEEEVIEVTEKNARTFYKL